MTARYGPENSPLLSSFLSPRLWSTLSTRGMILGPMGRLEPAGAAAGGDMHRDEMPAACEPLSVHHAYQQPNRAALLVRDGEIDCHDRRLRQLGQRAKARGKGA